MLGDRERGVRQTHTDKRSGRKAAVLRNAWLEANYIGSKGRNVESHFGGWSHLAVQRANQLANSGSEWTIKTLEAMERKKWCSPFCWKVTGVLIFKCCRNSATKTSLETCAKHVQAAARETLIHTESGHNYPDTQTVYGDFAFRKWVGDKQWVLTGKEMRQIDKSINNGGT